jgi:hypothetical protein
VTISRSNTSQERRNRADLNPGGIQTELGRHLDPAWIPEMIDRMNRDLAAEGKPPFQLKTIPQGAATSVWAGVVARADSARGGPPFRWRAGKRGLMTFRGHFCVLRPPRRG